MTVVHFGARDLSGSLETSTVLVPSPCNAEAAQKWDICGFAKKGGYLIGVLTMKESPTIWGPDY